MHFSNKSFKLLIAAVLLFCFLIVMLFLLAISLIINSIFNAIIVIIFDKFKLELLYNLISPDGPNKEIIESLLRYEKTLMNYK